MKKYVGLSCLLLLAAVFASCSDNAKMKNLLEQVPATADVVMVGNVKAVAESAGGSTADAKIKLPTDIADALPAELMNDFDEFNSFVKKAGIDPDACAVFADYEQNQPVFVFSLSDPKLLAAALEEKGFTEKSVEGSATFYVKKVYEGSSSEYDDYGYVAIDGSCAYWMESVWVGSDCKPLPYLQKVIDKAKEKSYADMPYGDYVMDGNAGGLAMTWPKELKEQLRSQGVPADLMSVYDGVMCLSAHLTDDKCTVNVQLFDEQGEKVGAEKFKDFMDTSATINGEALALLGKNESMVYAAVLKSFNWDKYAGMVAGAAGLSRADRAQLNAVMSYFEKIDGTVAVGFGLNEGLRSVALMGSNSDPMAQFSTTLVVETKEGKAKQLVEDFKGFLEQSSIPFTETATGLSIDLAQTGTGTGALYAEHKERFVVLANHPVEANNDNALVKNTDLTDYLFAFCVELNRENALMRDLKVDSDVKWLATCKPKTLEMSMTLEIEGGDQKGVIAKAAKIVMGLMKQSDDIGNRLRDLASTGPEPDNYDVE